MNLRILFLIAAIGISRWFISGQVFIGNTENTLRSVEIEILRPALGSIPDPMPYFMLVTPDSSDEHRITLNTEGVPSDDYQYYILNMLKHSTSVAYELCRSSPVYERVVNHIAGTKFQAQHSDSATFARLCQSFKVDGAALITEYKITIDVFNRTSGQAFGADETFVAYMNIHCYVGYRVFNASTGTFINGQFRYNRKIHSAEADYMKGAFIQLPDILDILDETAQNLGVEWARRLAPVWLKSTREFYATGDRTLREAAKFINQGKWDESFALWEAAVTSDNPIVVQYARFNLLLKDELTGNFEEALQRAKQYQRRNPDSVIDRYIGELKMRIEEATLLDSQLGRTSSDSF